MLEIQNLTKKYEKLLAVDNLSFKLKKGEIFGFIGPNGAGKSTTIRAVLNFIKKDNGVVLFNGKEVLYNDNTIKQKIGYLPSEINLYENLSGRQMIEYSKSFYKDIDEQYIENLVQRLNFDTSKKIETYSLGNKKKLGIILCLMHNPELIIMDEATSGLDPLMQEEFYKIIQEEKLKNKTILFSSHNLSEVKKICDRVGIIKQGKLLLVDEVKNILGAESVVVSLFLKEKIRNSQKPKMTIYSDDNLLKFVSTQNTEQLLKTISNYNIYKFLVEEPSIEDVFLHFYK